MELINYIRKHGNVPIKIKNPVVLVRNGVKKFNGKEVISGLNITIPEGAIYSLLGCSGCGKSTTLACILGLDKFTSGAVFVFGEKPGLVVNSLGRNLVGYMPQDYALHEELTILESFNYFGGLNGITGHDEIFKNLYFYTNLLDLPRNQNQLLRNLSGGQKRRVSLAISMQHEPELLILDEPTVGVDPLLRQRIWKHLSYLTKCKNTSVLITTHYVEEAKHSDVVGIMDNGKLIAEKDPFHLLQQFQTTSLESVVLSLTKNSRNNNSPEEELDFAHFPLKMVPKDPEPSKIAPSVNRVKSLVRKNWRVALRNQIMFAIALIIPATSLLTMYVGYGRNPNKLNFGVVNSDGNGTCVESLNMTDCRMDQFSCVLVHLLRNNPAFNLKEYNSVEEAEMGVKLGHSWGFLHIPPEYSWYLYERAVLSPAEVSNLDELIARSKLTVRLDKSSTPTAVLTQKELFINFKNFVLKLLSACGYGKRNLTFGLNFNEPIVGRNVFSLSDYVVPSMFINFVYMYPAATAGFRYVSEKRQGTLERSLVAGVRTWEIFLAYSIIEIVLAFGRMLVMYLLWALAIIKLNMEGSLALQFFLGVLSSYSGVCLGLVIGSFCSDEIQVGIIGMSIFMPNMLLTGQVWPVEGMPKVLQWVAPFLPTTLACEAMRSIINRGWGLAHPNVWWGFVGNLGHIVAYFLLAVSISKVTKINKNKKM